MTQASSQKCRRAEVWFPESFDGYPKAIDLYRSGLIVVRWIRFLLTPMVPNGLTRNLRNTPTNLKMNFPNSDFFNRRP